MVFLALLIAQAVTAQVVPGAAPEPGSPTSAVARRCAAGPAIDGEVVVCARARDADRLKPIAAPAEPERRFDPLMVRLPGGGSARLHAFQRALPGATSRGAAVTLTMPLGSRK